MLEEPGHELQGLQGQRGLLAGAALAIVPADFAIGQLLHLPIAGGGLEDVAGEITQGVLS